MHAGYEQANGYAARHSPPKWEGVWIYRQLPATASQIFLKEATERAAHSMARNAALSSHISGNRGYDSNRVHSPSIFHSYCVEKSMLNMGTSLITPCYEVKRLETKTHVGLGPGESIEYTKHRGEP